MSGKTEGRGSCLQNRYSESCKNSQAFQRKLFAFISGAWPVLLGLLSFLLCFAFDLYCAGDVHAVSVCAVLPGSLLPCQGDLD